MLLLWGCGCLLMSGSRVAMICTRFVVHDVSAAVAMTALPAKHGVSPLARHRRRCPRTGQFVRPLGAGRSTQAAALAIPPCKSRRPRWA